jgi:hypothetical protein
MNKWLYRIITAVTVIVSVLIFLDILYWAYYAG